MARDHDTGQHSHRFSPSQSSNRQCCSSNIHTCWSLPLSHDFHAICTCLLGSFHFWLDLTSWPLLFTQPPEHILPLLFSVYSLPGQPPTLPALLVISLASESQIHCTRHPHKVQTPVSRDHQVLSHSFFWTCLSCCHAVQAELQTTGQSKDRKTKESTR